MLLLSQTVRMEVALFHCSCMKGQASSLLDIPAETTEGCQRTESFTPFPGETYRHPSLISPGGRTGCCLERSLPMASDGHQESLQASLLHIEGLGYEAGMQHCTFIPAKLSWDLPLAK